MNPQFNQTKGSTAVVANKLAIARAYNFKDDYIIFSKDTATLLDNKRVIYDLVAQKSWGKPTSIPNGAKIVSVTGSTLVYSPGNVSIQMTAVPGSTEALANLLFSPTGGSMVVLEDGTSVQDFSEEMDQFRDVDSYRRAGDIRGYSSDNSVTPINAVITAGTDVGVVKIPKGSWIGNLALKNKTSLRGESVTSTVLTVPTNTAGIAPSGADVRGIRISDIALSVAGAVAGGPPVGTGIGLDFTGCTKSVNLEVANLYLDFFDIGLRSGPADFSNVYRNVRCNNNRLGFEISSNGQLIQNHFDTCYAVNFTDCGMRLRGVKGTIVDNMNFGHSGAANAYFMHIDTNSTGVIVNAPNFEMDAAGGKMTAGSQACLIASSSEVVFNSPHFNKVNPNGSNFYLFRVRGTSVVHINNPVVLNDDGTAGHLRIEDNAVVYLNDPKGVFTVISIVGSGKLIRVSDKLNGAPDYCGLATITPGLFVTLGFLASKVIIQPDFHSATVPATWKYVVYADTYSSTGFNARIIDTTTGAIVTTGVTGIPVTIAAWR